ncbi:MAG: M56 family metallopeptidase, partial [Bacteroidota bacterium]
MKALETLIPTNLAEAAGSTFMHALWQLAAIALLLMLVLLFVPRKSYRLRYGLGVGALLLMLAVPAATFMMSYEPATTATVFGPEIVLSDQFVHTIANSNSANGLHVFGDVTAFFQSNAYLFMGLWLLGTLLFTIRFVGGYAKVRRLRRHNTQPVPAQIEAILARLQERMGISRRVRILQSGSITVPMVIGSMKPVVLLPLGMLGGLSAEQIECILAHELAHVRRWDYLVNMAQSIVEILLFFHPAVWIVSKFVREERENCCDATVIALKHNKLVYARALLSLEAMRAGQPALAMAANGGSLFRRIKRITGAPEAGEKRPWSRGTLVGMVTLGLLLILSTTGSEKIKASAPIFNLVSPEIEFFENQFSDTDQNDDLGTATKLTAPAPK